MKIKTERDVLIEARERIKDREHWTTGAFSRMSDRRPSNSINEYADAVSFCADGALEACMLSADPLDSENWVPNHNAVSRARRALMVAAGVDHASALHDWNDSPKRRHKDILAAFDKAIKATPE